MGNTIFLVLDMKQAIQLKVLLASVIDLEEEDDEIENTLLTSAQELQVVIEKAIMASKGDYGK